MHCAVYRAALGVRYPFVYLVSLQKIILWHFATNMSYAFHSKDCIYLVCQMARNCVKEKEVGTYNVGGLKKRTLRILDK